MTLAFIVSRPQFIVMKTDNKSGSNHSEALDLKIPPALLMLLFFLIMWLTANSLPDLAFLTLEKKLLMRVIGAFGILLICSGMVSFRMTQTTVDPTQPENASTLVQTGIYRLTRNPMYAGFFVILVAWAVGLSHAFPWLFLPLFVMYMNRFQIKPEEQALLKLFGSEYKTYCHKVRRWI